MKLALCGSEPASSRYTPFANKAWLEWKQGIHAKLPESQPEGEWSIWGCSPGFWAGAQRATRWFEVHRWEPGQLWFSPEYCQFLRDFKGPVYTGAPIEEIPNHVVYPIDEMEAQFSSYFMTSSLALMLALAIDTILKDRASRAPEADQDDVIGLWGVDMAACLAAETKVLTADLRYVELGSVKVGDKLIAFDEQPGGGEGSAYRNWRCATVLQADKLMLPCYEVEMEDGTKFTASENHLWLTYAENDKRWKKTSELVTNHHRPGRPTKIVKPLSVWKEETSWEAGYLAAAVDGEGHLHQSQRDGGSAVALGYAQRDNEMRAAVLSAMENMGFSMIEAARNGTDNTCIKHTVAGGRSKIMEFMGRVRPRRLLGKFNPEMLGVMHAPNAVAVKSVKFIGDHPVIGIKTDTKTFIAEGYASHNSEEYGYQRPGCQFFILEAMRNGIGVYLPPESDLMRPMPVYGISEWDHNYIKLTTKARRLSQLSAEAGMEMEKQRATLQTVQGEMGALQSFVNTWTSPYGMKHGMVIRHTPGTGLGSGVTHVDGRTVGR